MAICGKCRRRGTVQEIRDCALNGIKHKGDKVPKMKWGAEDVDANSIDTADTGGEVYEGELPPAGVLDFEVRKLTFVKENNNGNPMLKIFLVATGGPTKATSKYKGLPIWDQIVVVKQNNFRTAAFCQAVGITGKDFLSPVTDENNVITKFGTVSTKGMTAKVLVKRGKTQDGDPRAEVNRFLPQGSGKAAKGSEPEEDDKPAKGASASKAKAGGKKKKGDEPPF